MACDAHCSHRVPFLFLSAHNSPYIADRANERTARSSFHPQRSMAVLGVALLVAVAVLVLHYVRQRGDDSKIYSIGGLHTWPFFARRSDFVRETFKRTGQNMFRFRVLWRHVVVLSGDEGRKLFFSEKTLDFNDGYKTFGPISPRPEDVNIHPAGASRTGFVKHVLSLSRNDRLAEILPQLLRDIDRHMVAMGSSGTMNPFVEIDQLVFRLTVRLGACRALADSIESVSTLWEHDVVYRVAASAPLALMLPWLPGRPKRDKQKATKGIFETIGRYVEARRQAAEQTTDGIDALIAQGYDDATVITYTQGFISAGTQNTTLIACWIIILLSDKGDWRANIIAEINALLETHGDAGDPVHKRFAAIPLDAWEEQLPALDAVLKETLRLILTGTALRRKIDGDIVHTSKRIKDGDFVAYLLEDIHFDSNIYPNPHSFNPSRFLTSEEKVAASTVPFPFLGWGVGRHPCAGMRTAKLEIKLLVALFLAKFEYEMVDVNGRPAQSLPQPNRNDIHNAQPVAGSECFVRYRAKDF
ncbi:hypothetical protein HMN09_00039200 [Mycena chlorophos]|uniref:Cytochrome P450 n=1 Tax=Mycena chlorophos TaxID=658473 RepID=A0A8H6WMA1_MYCCL|nr:hypothetical protein HMN09_00039200 [Mycena chlorophos]